MELKDTTTTCKGSRGDNPPQRYLQNLGRRVQTPPRHGQRTPPFYQFKMKFEILDRLFEADPEGENRSLDRSITRLCNELGY